mgnify:FL=1
MSLTVLGVTLAVAAFFSYFKIRNSAMEAAREAAEQDVREELPKLIDSQVLGKVLEDNPKLLLSAVSRSRHLGADVASETADGIAGASWEENNDEH